MKNWAAFEQNVNYLHAYLLNNMSILINWSTFYDRHSRLTDLSNTEPVEGAMKDLFHVTAKQILTS